VAIFLAVFWGYHLLNSTIDSRSHSFLVPKH